MGTLVIPSAGYHASWIVAAAEFGGARMDGSGMDGPPDVARLMHRDAFERFVDGLLADAREETPRPADRVPATALWIVDDGGFVGSLQIRHRLTPFLLEQGGHVGYSVRPTARRRGHASAALPIARELGIERVLVTADEDNLGSRAVIEGAGGEYEDSRAGKRRYWIAT